MKKNITYLRHVVVSVLMVGGLAVSVRAQGHYDFAEANDAGQMLYYTVVDSAQGGVSVRGGAVSQYSGVLLLPDSVTHDGTTYRLTAVGDSAFANCTSVTSVRLPEGLASVGAYAFDWCIALSEVVVPDGVTAIDPQAFRVVPNVVYHGTAEGAPWGALSVNAYEEDSLFFSDASKSVLTGCRRNIVGIRVPNTVRTIGPSALRFCREATSLTMPDGVVEIGNYACVGMNKLKSVTIPSTVERIGLYCFSNMSLDELTVADAAVEIGDYAFYWSGLKRVDLGNAARSIGRSAFSYCIDLDSIVIPRSMTRIDDTAFSYSSALKKVVMLGGVDTIHYATFDGCLALESLNLPASVCCIEGEAFSQCFMLHSLVSENPVPPAVFNNSFHMSRISDVEVPCGSKAAYEAAQYWKNYTIHEDCEGIAPVASEAPAFSLTPNPAKGDVVVTLTGVEQPHDATLHVSDASGREVLRQEVSAAVQHVDLATLPAGVYFVTLSTPQGDSVQRLILSR